MSHLDVHSREVPPPRVSREIRDRPPRAALLRRTFQRSVITGVISLARLSHSLTAGGGISQLRADGPRGRRGDPDPGSLGSVIAVVSKIAPDISANVTVRGHTAKSRLKCAPTPS